MEVDALLVYDVGSLPGVCVIAFTGEIDTFNAVYFAEALVEPTAACVDVDLSDVTLLDSSGLRALVAAQRHISYRNRKLRVVAASPVVRQVIESSGLSEQLFDPREAT